MNAIDDLLRAIEAHELAVLSGRERVAADRAARTRSDLIEAICRFAASEVRDATRRDR